MDVLVDTSVWSLGLRRRTRQRSPSQMQVHGEWADLVQEGRAAIIGPIRQELLSGIAEDTAFERLRERLRSFDDLPLSAEDHEDAARFDNRCRRAGVAGSAVDLLICAAAARRDLPVFTTDADFQRYAAVLPVQLHGLRRP